MTTATQLLHLKLVSLAKQELYPNCAIDSHLWLSDFDAERAEAVKRCRGCVVLTECAAMADEPGSFSKKLILWRDTSFGCGEVPCR